MTQSEQLKLAHWILERNLHCIAAAEVRAGLPGSRFRGRLPLRTRLAELAKGFSRDVRAIGHWGTGNLELSLRSQGDLDRAKPFIERAYSGDPQEVEP